MQKKNAQPKCKHQKCLFRFFPFSFCLKLRGWNKCFFLRNPRCRAPLDNSCFCYTEKKWVEAVSSKHFTTLLVLALKTQPQSCKKLCCHPRFCQAPQVIVMVSLVPRVFFFWHTSTIQPPRRRLVLAELRCGRTAETSAFWCGWTGLVQWRAIVRLTLPAPGRQVFPSPPLFATAFNRRHIFMPIRFYCKVLWYFSPNRTGCAFIAFLLFIIQECHQALPFFLACIFRVFFPPRSSSVCFLLSSLLSTKREGMSSVVPGVQQRKVLEKWKASWHKSFVLPYLILMRSCRLSLQTPKLIVTVGT